MNRDIDPKVLVNQARRELRLKGYTDVRCPKCGKAPILEQTERGERTMMFCECRYLHTVEINL